MNIFQREKENIPAKVNTGIDYSVKTPNILRTIYLENDDISNLKQEIEFILEKTADERAAYEAEIQLLSDEKSRLDAFA